MVSVKTARSAATVESPGRIRSTFDASRYAPSQSPVVTERWIAGITRVLAQRPRPILVFASSNPSSTTMARAPSGTGHLLEGRAGSVRSGLAEVAGTEPV